MESSNRPKKKNYSELNKRWVVAIPVLILPSDTAKWDLDVILTVAKRRSMTQLILIWNKSLDESQPTSLSLSTTFGITFFLCMLTNKHATGFWWIMNWRRWLHSAVCLQQMIYRCAALKSKILMWKLLTYNSHWTIIQMWFPVYVFQTNFIHWYSYNVE